MTPKARALFSGLHSFGSPPNLSGSETASNLSTVYPVGSGGTHPSFLPDWLALTLPSTLWAVMVSVKTAPFPLGQAEPVYRKVLEMVKTDPAKVFANGTMPDLPLGDLRKAIVFQAGDGCNAPTDSYLRIAKQIKLGEYVDSY